MKMNISMLKGWEMLRRLNREWILASQLVSCLQTLAIHYLYIAFTFFIHYLYTCLIHYSHIGSYNYIMLYIYIYIYICTYYVCNWWFSTCKWYFICLLLTTLLPTARARGPKFRAIDLASGYIFSSKDAVFLVRWLTGIECVCCVRHGAWGSWGMGWFGYFAKHEMSWHLTN